MLQVDICQIAVSVNYSVVHEHRHDRDFKTRLGNDRKNTYRRNIEVKLWKGDVGHWLTLFSSTYLSLDWHIRSVLPIHFPLMRI